MRISDWSSDVCSSDLLPAPSKSLCPAGEDLPRHHIRRPGSKVEGRSSRYSALTLIAERGFGELHDFRIGIRHIHRHRRLQPIGDIGQRHYASGFLVIAVPHLPRRPARAGQAERSEEHTSELQSLMRISYAVFCLKKKTKNTNITI